MENMVLTPNGVNSRSGTETVAPGSGKNGSFPCESGPSATLAAREVTLADPAGALPDRPHCLDAALDYTKRGFSVILLHGIVDGHCTCGQPDCISPGEHPIDSWKTAQTERASPEQLEAAFLRNPHANVGIVTGAVSGLVVVDIFGPYGLTSISKIVDEPPNLPSVRTGNGHHVYGRHPGTALKNFVKTYPGLDGRADGGYVVAPPSRHASGKDYIWRRLLEDPVPELPAELLALFSSSGEQREPSPKRKSRRDDAGSLPTIKAPARREYAEKALTDECNIVAAAPIGAQEIADFYDLTESGDGFTGDCPCCGYRGFSLTEKDGHVLFYCHGGGCDQEEIIEVLRKADLWVAPVSEHLFPPLDDEPPKAGRQPARNTPKSGADALAIWRRSSPAAGTIVATYLRARGYHGSIPVSLRYVTGKHPSDDALHPVMVAAVIRPDRPPGIIGVHRTFLLPDGSAKAGFDPNKMSLGPIGGGGVPLAAPGPKIAVSEGIETGLSFMQATGIPTWAALSAGGIKKLLLPPDVREVLIAADADPAGISAARIAAQRWHAEGRKVRIVKPPEGFDFNDLARAS